MDKLATFRHCEMPRHSTTLSSSSTHIVVNHVMLTLLSLILVHYKCQYVFYKNVHGDLISSKNAGTVCSVYSCFNHCLCWTASTQATVPAKPLCTNEGWHCHRTACMASLRPWATLWTPACKPSSKVDWPIDMRLKKMLSIGLILWRLQHSQNNNGHEYWHFYPVYWESCSMWASSLQEWGPFCFHAGDHNVRPTWL